jgi:hypothetical protein
VLVSPNVSPAIKSCVEPRHVSAKYAGVQSKIMQRQASAGGVRKPEPHQSTVAFGKGTPKKATLSTSNLQQFNKKTRTKSESKVQFEEAEDDMRPDVDQEDLKENLHEN